MFSLFGLPLLSLREGLGRGVAATGLRHASRVGPLARDDAHLPCGKRAYRLSENDSAICVCPSNQSVWIVRFPRHPEWAAGRDGTGRSRRKGGGSRSRLCVFALLPLPIPRALSPRADPSFLAAHPSCRGKLCGVAEQWRASVTTQTPESRRELDDGASALCAAVVAATLAQTRNQSAPDRADLSGDHPAIYVACLAAYNNGILHGETIRAEDADDMRRDTQAMLARSPIPDAEEWAIHDYAGFEGACIEEYTSFESVAELAAFIEERGELGAKVLEHYGQDLEDARKAFENYSGEFESLADYAQQLTEDCGTEIPESLRHYIDYQSMGEDTELNGDVFTIKMGFQCIHVFGGH